MVDLNNSNKNKPVYSCRVWQHFSKISVLTKKFDHWSSSNQSRLLAIGLLSMLLLIFVHISAVGMSDMIATNNSLLSKVMTVLTITLIAFTFLPIVHKGIVPIAIAGIGLPLLYAGVHIPINIPSLLSPGISVNYAEIFFVTEGYFLLGVSMIAFSIISAYRPSLLYVRNRPKESDDICEDKYPLWNEPGRGTKHVVSVGRFDDEVYIPLKNLMSERETYLLWRYSYILVAIRGIRYLATPNSYVPISSMILRDEKYRMLGKDRYSSSFV